MEDWKSNKNPNWDYVEILITTPEQVYFYYCQLLSKDNLNFKLKKKTLTICAIPTIHHPIKAKEHGKVMD